MQSLRVRLERQQLSYNIRIGRDLRLQAGQLLRSALGEKARRIAVISSKRVFALYGSEVMHALRGNDFTVLHWLMPEGERFKTFRSLERAVLFLAESGLERTDAVVALGGGVVGDLGGFTAAVYLRGIPVVQMPTTLLAQIDSSVGGKTGINLPLGKNMTGAFHQPSSVVIDTQTLTTLPRRELVSGFCEAVKQGAIANRKLFKQTTDLLAAFRLDRKALLSAQMEHLVARHCAFKASIVAGDERESGQRSDKRSRKVLNFGHTTAHALEAATSYRRFRHGEAVGYGMLVAGQISKSLGLLEPSELESLTEAVRFCGALPPAGDLDKETIIEALSHDKKSVAGQIKWVLLEKIGHPLIVDGKEISPRLLRLSLAEGLRNAKE
ncbi:MAG TPA: 3-dehydroquinate synthase [Pyrinomonadaceae bacterium]|nr:3-dehydroquinate synthase [Pyrinomonadaceae bacterium]